MGVYNPNMEMPSNCTECIEFKDDCEHYWDYYCTHESRPNDCPLTEIVTCGECKWCDDKGKGRALICTNPYIDMDIHPLDFCSYGKRRTDETIESITFKKMVKAVKEEMREVQNFAERRNDGTVCSYGVPANADQHTQRVESVGERRSDETN